MALVYGNRGCLHDETGRIRRSYAGRRWIACRLEFRGWQRAPLLQPGRFTELFFLDEATAFAAGHRPCALCRREDYVRFQALWLQLHGGQVGADSMDLQLHAERLTTDRRSRRLYRSPMSDLPDGAFVLRDAAPWIVVGTELLRWTPAGYADRTSRTADSVDVLTPESLVAVLHSAWKGVVPLLHPSARASR